MLLEDTLLDDLPAPKTGEPIWELATRYPLQGTWTEEEYLQLTDSWNRLIEFTDGELEFLAMPTVFHQRLLSYLFSAFKIFVSDHQLGEVLSAGTRIKLSAKVFREPDIVFIASERRLSPDGRYFGGADLVLEIVSDDPGSRKRDLVNKVSDYAAAGIAEYWIVDPEEQKITVLTLEGAAYVPHGEFAPGQSATSKLLSGFTVDVAEVFAAQR